MCLLPGRNFKGKMPAWLKSELPDAYALRQVTRKISSLGLSTICFEARCPNKNDCFSKGSVTFLILGKNCTRRCSFCNVVSGPPDDPDSLEPARIKQACDELGLGYVIVTSVTRDDLPDGGSYQFRRCVKLLKGGNSCPAVEVLTPDFGGRVESVEDIASAGLDVFGHNIETVERIYHTVRDKAIYGRSLGILAFVRSKFPDVIVKSGLMVGLGESLEEVRSAIRDLSEAGCDIVTIGQYMRPSRDHLPVRQYLEPVVFDDLGCYASELGLIAISGPRVRSSYLAEAAFGRARSRRQRCA